MIPPPDAAQRLAAIVESSEDAIVSKDLNGTITTWNRGAEQLFGYTAEEAIGQSILLVIPPDRRGEEDLVLEKIRRGERVEHFDTVRRRKGGELVDLSLTVSPIRDDDGRIVGASKIARDITHRKRIERELEDLHRRLLGLAVTSASVLRSPDVEAVLSAAIDLARDVFAADGHAVWRADGQGRWRVVRSVGISEEFATRVVRNPVADANGEVPFREPLVCPDVREQPLLAHLQSAYRAEGIRSMVVYPLPIGGRRSGTMVFYSRQPRTYSNVDVQVGTAVANLAAAALTTAELYEQQRHAREASDHARQQAAFLSDASVALGASLDYEVTLRAIARLAVPEIADGCAIDLVGDRGALERIATADHGDPAEAAFTHVSPGSSPDGSSGPGAEEVVRTAKPLLLPRIAASADADAGARDDAHLEILRALQLRSYICVPLLVQGRAIGAITLVSGESGRVYDEDDLRFAQELASRAALSVESARAYARANEASRLKDEFLATLSHELRTPLNAVLGYTRMLRLGMVAAEKVNPALDVIERNGTALKQIIEDVLDVSRIVAGRLRLNVSSVDLPTVLQESIATVMPAADAKGVRLETVIDPLTTPVSGDADRLQQIIWNLLSNAIKFTPRGGRVQLRLSRVESHVEVTVSDTGIGIAPDFLPFVFERFRQGDASFSRGQGGLGLGLAIARQLAELHGGTVTAASDGPGHGATFTLKLPLMIVHVDPTDALHLREQPRADRRVPVVQTVPRLDGIHVLAVDDERDSLNLLRSVLEEAGARVTVAHTAAAALEAVRTVVPDVVVADIGMPGMDGLQLIRAIRQLDAPVRNIPAAALTAYARSQDRITSLASGYQMHLVKPIEPLELIVAVSTLAPRRAAT